MSLNRFVAKAVATGSRSKFSRHSTLSRAETFEGAVLRLPGDSTFEHFCRTPSDHIRNNFENLRFVFRRFMLGGQRRKNNCAFE